MKRERAAEKRAEKPEAVNGGTGRNPGEAVYSAASPTLVAETDSPGEVEMMEQVVERGNMKQAYERVVSNQGAAGVDGMGVEELLPYLQGSWARIKEELVSGRYQPGGIRMVEIPKASGGKRQLGIPTVVDRMIQQALQQVLSPLYEPTFSEHSYGFRPGRSTHGAIQKAREYQREGRRWVVDMDLAKFFDEVNHDRLMSRLAIRVKDKRVIRLIRKYLQAGMMIDGLVQQREKGTPQGSPLSPLLSNIVLDELDKELERRGHRFGRYADDCNIYVKSRKAGERVMASITIFVEEKLKLKVNREKSAVARPWQRKFLGYSFTQHKEARIRVSEISIERFREKAKEAFRRGRGRNMERFIKEDLNPMIRGWITYFNLAETKGFAEDLDGWIRRRLRVIVWRQCKKPRTRLRRLIQQGISPDRAAMSAYNGRGAWWNSGASHMNQAFPKKYFASLGLFSMLDYLTLNGKH